MMDNTKQIRSAGTYWSRHQPPAVQRKTQRERPALFTFAGTLPPTVFMPDPWYTRVLAWLNRTATLLDALVLCICVVAIVALAFGLGRT